MKNKIRSKIRLILLIGLFPSLFLGQGRDHWQQPEKIMDIAGVKEGMIIGEAGAGSGYFTYHLSERVGNQGRIYANDIVRSELKKIRKHCLENKISNITTILGEEKDPLFPVEQMDMVLICGWIRFPGCRLLFSLCHPTRFLKTFGSNGDQHRENRKAEYGE